MAESLEYTALYRKYRPQYFKDLVGQEHISRTLTNALKNKRVSHAYLFCGPRGTGKTSAAKILARAANCPNLNAQGEPCGVCASCQAFLIGPSMDIVEIDAASNRGIDEIRDLRERTKYAPAQGKYRVYIIDEVHMLTTEAFNALLKTLEEPPGHVMFILATTEPHKVPLTVLSRCQRFDFRRIREKDILGRLAHIVEQENIATSAEALPMIAHRAEGSLRDAISLLDQCWGYAQGEITPATIEEVLGISDGDFLAKMAKGLVEGDVVGLVTGVEELSQYGLDMRQFLHDLLETLRQELLLSLEPGYAGVADSKRLLAILQDLANADNRLRYTTSPRITLEIALLAAAQLPEAVQIAPAIRPGAELGQTGAAKAPVSRIAAEGRTGFKPGSTDEEISSFLIERWPEILRRIKKAKVATGAYLQEGGFLRFADGRVFLGYEPRYQVHKENILLPAHRQVVEMELAKILGRNVSLAAEFVEVKPETVPKNWWGGNDL